MSEPVVLRITRPYASEEAYLEAEGWSIDDKGMVLIDQPELPRDTTIRFEVVLEDGSRPIRAEGKVSKVVAATANRPGGLKVRFRRFGATTKELIDRLLAQRKPRRSRRPEAPLVLDPDPAFGSDAEASVEVMPPSVAPVPQAAPPPVAATAADAAPAPPRAAGPVPAPPNREELLARLRERAARATKPHSESAADETG